MIDVSATTAVSRINLAAFITGEVSCLSLPLAEPTKPEAPGAIERTRPADVLDVLLAAYRESIPDTETIYVAQSGGLDSRLDLAVMTADEKRDRELLIVADRVRQLNAAPLRPSPMNRYLADVVPTRSDVTATLRRLVDDARAALFVAKPHLLRALTYLSALETEKAVGLRWA